MNITIFTFIICLSIANLNNQNNSAKINKLDDNVVTGTRSGATTGRILSNEEITKYEEAVKHGNTDKIQDLYRHYELSGEIEKSYEWLKYGLEHNDMWSLCEMCAHHKDLLEESELNKLKEKIAKLRDEEKKHVFYTSEIFGIEWAD